jgi:hypothetical protein
MASLQKIIEAAAWEEFSSRAPHFDEYVERLTAAEEALEEGDLQGAKDFVAYLNSYGDLFHPLTLASTTDAQLANPAAWPKRMPPAKPQRPPILYGDR